MIIDHIQNANTYRSLGRGVAQAFDYLRHNDFSTIEPGRHDLDGDRLFAIVQRFVPNPPMDLKFESHRQYIDVQYIASGREAMGWVALGDPSLKVLEDNADDDYIIYSGQGQLIEFTAGQFVLFSPQDVHAPNLAPAGMADGSEVVKAVVKVRIED